MAKGSGHSSIRVALLCVFCFFLGRFLSIPGLPDTGKGMKIVRDKASSRRSLTQGSGTLRQDAERTAAPNLDRSQPERDDASETFESVIESSGLLDDRPPVGHGHSGHPFYTVQPMQLLSWHPRAYLFPKFMDADKCKHVIEIASRRLYPSGLALKKGDTMASTQEVRTSQGTFMSRTEDKEGVLAWIEDKIAVLTGIPAGHGEPFNILRYEQNQHYDSHYDSFDEESYGKQASKRIATVLVYLSDVEEGGETSFLFEGVNGTKRIATVDYKRCNTGIKYKPRAGDALLFWSIHPDSTLDKHSLHGGCPVLKGTKWTATKWIRDKCMGSSLNRPACSGSEVP